jgi:hypothetical protein
MIRLFLPLEFLLLGQYGYTTTATAAILYYTILYYTILMYLPVLGPLWNEEDET